MAVFTEHPARPGPKEPSRELIAAILEIKRLVHASAVRVLPRRFRTPSAWRSTRTWCAPTTLRSFAGKPVGAPGLPTTLFFDRNGRLQRVHMGELSAPRLADYLSSIAEIDHE